MNLTEVNDEGDSSDSENENDVNEPSDDDDELSFESDDEGNYQQNLNKKHSLVDDSDSDEIGDDDDDDEQEESDGSEAEELSDEAEVSGESDASDADDGPESAYISDDSEDLSFEEDDSDDDENVPSVNSNDKSKKPTAITETSKQNGKASSKATTSNSVKINATEKPPKTSEPGSLLRINKNNKQSTNAVDAFKSELKQSGSSSSGGGGNASKNATSEIDEYKFDTDDEEDIRNTVGNIPMKWYDEQKHIGYDWDAKKIIKPPKRDQLDDFLKRMEDPNFWRTVKDPQTGQDVILSEADIDLIKRINSRRVPDANFEDYAVRFKI